MFWQIDRREEHGDWAALTNEFDASLTHDAITIHHGLRFRTLFSPSTIQKIPGTFISGLRPVSDRPAVRYARSRIASFSMLTALLLPFVGMHLLGIVTFHWLELSIVPWDIAIVLSGAIVLVLVLTGRIEIPERLPIVFFLIVAMLAWFAVEAARSPTPYRGWTMVLLLIRDIVMFGTVFLILYKRPNIEQLNFWVSILGLAFTAVALPLFLMNLDTFGERLPFNGMIVLWEDLTPRFIGLARDPNFFGLTASISLLTLPFATRIPVPLRWLGAALLLTAIFFAGSRLLPASMLVGTAVLISLLIVLRQRVAIRQLLVTLVPGLLIALIAMPLWSLGPDYPSSLGTRIFERYELGTKTPRTELWAQTAGTLGDGTGVEAATNTLDRTLNFILGNGLRSNQETLSGQYSHNTYLDLLGETGMVGLVLWLVITGIVTVQGFRAVRRNSELTPWLAIWLIVLLFSYGFSLLVAPYYWFFAAVITGLGFRRISVKQEIPQVETIRPPATGLGRLTAHFWPIPGTRRRLQRQRLSRNRA